MLDRPWHKKCHSIGFFACSISQFGRSRMALTSLVEAPTIRLNLKSFKVPLSHMVESDQISVQGILVLHFAVINSSSSFCSAVSQSFHTSCHICSGSDSGSWVSHSRLRSHRAESTASCIMLCFLSYVLFRFILPTTLDSAPIKLRTYSARLCDSPTYEVRFCLHWRPVPWGKMERNSTPTSIKSLLHVRQKAKKSQSYGPDYVWHPVLSHPLSSIPPISTYP